MASPDTKRHRLRRGLLIALGVFVVLLIIGRIVLDPLARHFTAKALENNEDFKASFSDVHVSVIPPAYSITDFKLVEKGGSGRWTEPLFYVERARVSVLWREVLRLHWVGDVVLENPKIVALRRHEEKAEKAPEAGKGLADMAPIKLDRLEIRDGEILIGVGKGKQAPKLWVNKLNLVAENMATRKAMMEGEPSTLRLRGRVQKTGRLTATASMDPWARKLTFSTKAALENLSARELYAFTAKETELQAEKGEVDLFVEVKAKDGVLHGGVKPVLKNIEVKAVGDGLGDRLKATLADASIELLSDDIPGRDAVATTIPIKGRVDQPSAQILPTVLGVLRNAFVVGLRSGFDNLPPPVAAKKENPVKQAWRALTKEDEPPRAQPEAGAQQEAAAAKTDVGAETNKKEGQAKAGPRQETTRERQAKSAPRPQRQ